MGVERYNHEAQFNCLVSSVDFNSLPEGEILAQLKTNYSGLDELYVQRRLETFGPN